MSKRPLNTFKIKLIDIKNKKNKKKGFFLKEYFKSLLEILLEHIIPVTKPKSKLRKYVRLLFNCNGKLL
mgnify:CR=1 FL=1